MADSPKVSAGLPLATEVTAPLAQDTAPSAVGISQAPTVVVSNDPCSMHNLLQRARDSKSSALGLMAIIKAGRALLAEAPLNLEFSFAGMRRGVHIDESGTATIGQIFMPGIPPEQLRTIVYWFAHWVHEALSGVSDDGALTETRTPSALPSGCAHLTPLIAPLLASGADFNKYDLSTLLDALVGVLASLDLDPRVIPFTDATAMVNDARRAQMERFFSFTTIISSSNVNGLPMLVLSTEAALYIMSAYTKDAPMEFYTNDVPRLMTRLVDAGHVSAIQRLAKTIVPLAARWLEPRPAVAKALLTSLCVTGESLMTRLPALPTTALHLVSNLKPMLEGAGARLDLLARINRVGVQAQGAMQNAGMVNAEAAAAVGAAGVVTSFAGMNLQDFELLRNAAVIESYSFVDKPREDLNWQMIASYEAAFLATAAGRYDLERWGDIFHVAKQKKGKELSEAVNSVTSATNELLSTGSVVGALQMAFFGLRYHGDERIAAELSTLERWAHVALSCVMNNQSATDAVSVTAKTERANLAQARAEVVAALKLHPHEGGVLPLWDAHAVDPLLVQARFTDTIIGTVRRLWAETLSQMGPPPGECAVLALGSMAHGAMALFSDLEFAMVTKRSFRLEVDVKKYFTAAIRLFELKVIALGETPPTLNVPTYVTGFCFDSGGNTPLKKEPPLIGTPQELAAHLSIAGGDMILLGVLPEASLIAGSETLFEAFQAAVSGVFDDPSRVGDNRVTARVEAAMRLMREALHFAPPNDIRKAPQLDPKKDLYRLPNLLINGLAILFSVPRPAAQTYTWANVLRDLSVRGHIAPRLASLLVEVFALVAYLRLAAHAHARTEHDVVSLRPLDASNLSNDGAGAPLIASRDVIRRVEHLVRLVLSPLHRSLSDYLEQLERGIRNIRAGVKAQLAVEVKVASDAVVAVRDEVRAKGDFSVAGPASPALERAAEGNAAATAPGTPPPAPMSVLELSSFADMTRFFEATAFYGLLAVTTGDGFGIARAAIVEALRPPLGGGATVENLARELLELLAVDLQPTSEDLVAEATSRKDAFLAWHARFNDCARVPLALTTALNPAVWGIVHEYDHVIRRYTAATNDDLRAEVRRAVTRVHSVTHGLRLFRPQSAAVIFRADDGTLETTISYGPYSVNNRLPGLLLTACPPLPAASYAASLLHFLLDNSGAPAPLFVEEVLTVHHDGTNHVLAALPKPEGATMLGKVLRAGPGMLDKWSLYHFSLACIVNLLLNPVDGSPKNLVVIPSMNTDGDMTRVDVASVNTEAHFVDTMRGFPATALPRGSAKQALFCANHMTQPIDARLRAELVKADAGVLLGGWLESLARYNARVEAVFDTDSQRAHFERGRCLPFLISPSVLNDIYNRFLRIQVALRADTPVVTHVDLLFATQPERAVHYDRVLQQPDLNLEQRYQQLPAKPFDNTEDASASGGFLSFGGPAAKKKKAPEQVVVSSLDSPDLRPEHALVILRLIASQHSESLVRHAAAELRQGNVIPFRRLAMFMLQEQVLAQMDWTVVCAAPGIANTPFDAIRELPLRRLALINVPFPSPARDFNYLFKTIEAPERLVHIDLSGCEGLRTWDPIPWTCPELQSLSLARISTLTSLVSPTFIGNYFPSLRDLDIRGSPVETVHLLRATRVQYSEPAPRFFALTKNEKDSGGYTNMFKRPMKIEEVNSAAQVVKERAAVAAAKSKPKDDELPTFNIALLGGARVGKSLFLHRCTLGRDAGDTIYAINSIPLICDVPPYNLVGAVLRDTSATKVLADTAAERRLLEQAHGAVLMYDVSNRRSFEVLERLAAPIDAWMYSFHPLRAIVVANQRAGQESQVTSGEGEAFARAHGFDFHEVDVKGATVSSVQDSLRKLCVSMATERALTGDSPLRLPIWEKKSITIKRIFVTDEETKVHAEKDGKPLLLKLLVLGDMDTGKSAWVLRAAEGSFQESYTTTIGIDFKIMPFLVDNKTQVRLQLLDTAGQERFGEIAHSYMSSAHAILVFFAVDNASSIARIPRFAEQALSDAPTGTPLILIANKCDLPKAPFCASPKLIEDLAAEHGFTKWYETSAKTQENMDNILNDVAKLALAARIDR